MTVSVFMEAQITEVTSLSNGNAFKMGVLFALFVWRGKEKKRRRVCVEK